MMMMKAPWICLWWFCWNSALRQGTATTTTSLHGNSRSDSDRTLAVYALYNLPPFDVTFITKATAEVLQQQQQGISVSTTGSNSVLYDLRTITQSFLLDQFKTQITAAAQQANSDPSYTGYNQMYGHLMAVDLQIQLSFANGNGGRLRRDLQSTTHVTMEAQMFGTVAFLEPQDPSTKPSNEQVMALFGGWMSMGFTNDKDTYLRMLVQSSQSTLQGITQLSVTVSNPSGQASNNSSPGIWRTAAEKVLMSFVILIGACTLCVALAYARQRHLYNKNKFQYESETISFDESPSQGPTRSRLGSMDAVRHGTDVTYSDTHIGAMSVLQASDRYLSKHRPDLYDSNGRSSVFSPVGGGGEVSPAASFSSLSVMGREYVIPSNPFEYIYSAFASDSTVPANRAGPFTPRRENSFRRVGP